MPCKKHRSKRKTRNTFNANQPLKLVSDTTKLMTGVAVLGITATALTNLAKKK